MDELKSLVAAAREGDLDAYSDIVSRFQDMAYGFAYSLLADFHLAEDATQEAFVEAYCCLGKLREPAAFPGWLRRIVLKRCDRLTRRKAVPTVSPEALGRVAASDGEPSQAAERREMKDAVLEAIRALPEHERTATTLYYIDGYSQKDIAEFLEVPVTTVKNRLHDARKRLKERMMPMVKETLESSRPGPERRRAIMNELMRRVAEFDRTISREWKPSQAWADRWHDQRMVDVRANAAQYGIDPDETLRRMEPEYQARHTFRDDFKDLPRRWGIPEQTRLISIRELCRAVSVTPLALVRWQVEGMPILKYTPWLAYDEDRVRAWIDAREIRPQDQMTPADAREPMGITLKALAEGEATVDEAKAVFSGLATSTYRLMRGAGDVDQLGREALDPLWADEWESRRPVERKANAGLYGLDEPTRDYLGIPSEVVAGPEVHVFEIRDLSRRLKVSPFDVVRWTNEGMPCLRYSPWVRWDVDLVSRWVADNAVLPADEYSPKDLDGLEEFVLTAVAIGRQPPSLAQQILTGWSGLM